jgi:two-component system, NarL family, invasion response regulator UvrY
MIRVLIADDHAFVRRGVKETLDDAAGIVTVGEAANGYEALQLVQNQQADVLILDISMPYASGLSLLEQLHGLQPALRVLILSIFPEKQYALQAIKAGAYGYLTKSSAPDELITAVRMIARGEKYITQSLAQDLANLIDTHRPQAPHNLLSSREYEVMLLLARGKTAAEIGRALTISAKTVGSFRVRILDKLGLKNTAEIIRYAVEHALLAA